MSQLQMPVTSIASDMSITSNDNSILKNTTNLCESYQKTNIRKWTVDQPKGPFKYHKKWTVLVANDSKYEIERTLRMLNKADKDVTVVVAKNGKEAFEIYKKKIQQNMKFHWIFLEMEMPDYNGLDAISMIREYENMHSIPLTHCCIMVDSDSDDYHEKYEKYNVNWFVVRP